MKPSSLFIAGLVVAAAVAILPLGRWFLARQEAHERALQGIAALDAAQYSVAVAEFSTAIALRPEDDWTWYYQRASAYERLAQPEFALALADFRKAHALTPSGETRTALCTATCNLDDPAMFDEAYRLCTEALGADRSIALISRAKVLISQKKYADAVADATAAYGLGQDTVEALELRVKAFTMSGQTAEAGRDCAALLTMHESLFGRGLCAANAWDRGDPETIVKHLAEPEILGDPNLLVMRANALGHLARQREALADFDRAHELRPTHAQTLISRGWTWAELGEFAKAEQDATAALHLEPDNVAASATRCFARAGLEDFAGALPDCTLAQRDQPDSHVALGMLAYVRGQNAVAVTEWTLAGKQPGDATLVAPWLVKASAKRSRTEAPKRGSPTSPR